MSALDEVRQAYPQYNDWPDDELAEGLYEKYYSDMSPSEYYKEIGLPNPHAGLQGVGEDVVSGLKGAFPKAGQAIGAMASGAYDLVGGNIPESDMTLANHLRKMVGMKTEGEKEHGYSPERFAKVVGSSLMKGGRGLLNVPGNIVDYAHEKEIAPEWLDAWRPSETVQNFDYDKEMGIEGQRPGDAIPASAGMIPSLAATGLNPYAAIGVQSIGENENPLENMLAAKIVETGVKYGPKVIKETAKGMGSDIESMKNFGSKHIAEPYRKYREGSKLKGEINNSESSLLAATENAEIASKAIENKLGDYLSEQRGTVKRSLANATKSGAEALKEKGISDYNDFRNSKYGQKRIFAPIQAEFFEKQFTFPKDAISEVTQGLIDSTIGKYKQTMKIDSLTGQPRFSVQETKVKPTVNQYIKLDKQLRDESLNFRKRANVDGVSLGEAEKLRAKAKSLDTLRDSLQEKIKGSIPESAFTRYQGMNDFWREYVIPFEEVPFLENIIKKGAIKRNKVLETLDSEGLQPLKEALMKNPEFAESVAKHDWQKVNFKNAETLSKALESDLGKVLPKDVKAYVEQHFNELSSQTKTVELLKKKLAKDKLSKKQIDAEVSKYLKAASSFGLKSGGIAATAFALKLLTGI